MGLCKTLAEKHARVNPSESCDCSLTSPVRLNCLQKQKQVKREVVSLEAVATQPFLQLDSRKMINVMFEIASSTNIMNFLFGVLFLSRQKNEAISGLQLESSEEA